MVEKTFRDRRGDVVTRVPYVPSLGPLRGASLPWSVDGPGSAASTGGSVLSYGSPPSPPEAVSFYGG